MVAVGGCEGASWWAGPFQPSARGHNESDEAEGPNCTLLVFSDVGLFRFPSLSLFEDLVTFERNSSIPFFFLIPFSLGLFLFLSF